ncbi:hypothetical protein RND81_06G126000 [Saponaria officinalis]|uniref:Uncharacterized protein n=1 Tax=Saponaria officinalis TaxID=3572 RepID=A0AAW1K9U8_SAPOF
MLSSEVNCLRVELNQVRDDRDRDRLNAQVQHLTSEIEKYNERTGKSVAELENLMMKSNTLEETCASQRQQLQLLQHQLASANEKLKMADMSVSETRTVFDGQKQEIIHLKNRLAEAEIQIKEKELLRRKLHNTILELMGNLSFPSSNEGHVQGKLVKKVASNGVVVI